MTQEQKKIFDQLNHMAELTGDDPIEENEFENYLNQPNPKEETIDVKINGVNNTIAEKITELLMKDNEGAKKILSGSNEIERIASLKAAAEKKERELAEKAAQEIKKLGQAKQNSEIKEARRKMKELAEARRKVDKARMGTKGREKGSITTSAPTNDGAGESYLLGSVIANQGFGSADDRTKKISYPTFNGEIPRDLLKHYREDNQRIAPKNIEEAKESLELDRDKSKDIIYTKDKIQLSGHKYVPQNWNGKVAIVFSGSGAPGSTYIKNCMKNYIENRTAVVQLDYRGFGQSCNLDKNNNPKDTKFSEKTAYQDAHIMYEKVLEDMNVQPSNVILHGYSMGGPIAAKLAADIAQSNAKKAAELENKGQILSEKQQLGGLVMHSPMVSNYYAYKTMGGEMFGSAFGPIIGFLGKITGGSFDTVAHLKNLKKYDPNIPVHYVGGQENDWLSPHNTKIHENPDIKFTNQSCYFGDNHHMTEIDRKDPYLSELSNKTRAADLNKEAELDVDNEIRLDISQDSIHI